MCIAQTGGGRRRAAAAVSHVVACKDLDAGEEEAGGGHCGDGGDVGRVGVVDGVGGGEGVGVAVAVDRPRTSPFSCAFFSILYEQSRSLHSSNGKCCLPVARRHLSKSS